MERTNRSRLRPLSTLLALVSVLVLAGCAGVSAGSNTQPPPPPTTGGLAVSPSTLNFGSVAVGNTSSLTGTVGFDRRHHRFIRVVERFRIFRKRNHFPDERAGGSKRAVHGDFYPTRSWQFAGQHFFRKQCFGLFVETVVQRIRNADDQSAQRVADVESQHFNGSGI